MPLKFKPKDQQIRMVYTDGPEGAMPEHRGKVFAVIGPFENFSDKPDLQDKLKKLLRSYNVARKRS